MGKRSYIYTIWPDKFPEYNLRNPEFFTDDLATELNIHVEKGIIKSYTFQLEQGEGEHPHVQLYIQYEKESRGDRIERLIGLRKHQYHGVEQRFGSSDDMRDYCSKEDGRLLGPYEGGEFESVCKGARLDLRRVARGVREGADLRSIAERYPVEFIKFHKGIERLKQVVDAPSATRFEPREVVILTGPPGCGKTRWVVENYGASLWWAPANFSKEANWFDGYEGEETALFDDFTGNYPYEAMLRITDGYEQRVPVKGGFTTWRPRRICFTSNVPVECWWPLRNEIHAFERRIVRKITFEEAVPRSEVGGNNTSLPPTNLGTEEDTVLNVDMNDAIDADEFMDAFGL